LDGCDELGYVIDGEGVSWMGSFGGEGVLEDSSSDVKGAGSG
jgi:hypothetical protein